MPVDDSQSVKNKKVDQMSTVEQEHDSNCSNRIKILQNVHKDKSFQDSENHSGT